jgi:rhodanese-related sulfurtransferase
MYTPVDRDGIRELDGRGGQIVEVLPASAYEEQHLPRAISLPLARLDQQAAGSLLRDRPIVVYCHDSQ